MMISGLHLGVLFGVFLMWGTALYYLSLRIMGSPLRAQRLRCSGCSPLHNLFHVIPFGSFFACLCKNCRSAEALTRPIAELVTAFSLTALMLLIEPQYRYAYFLGISMLMISFCTDLSFLLLSRLVMLPLIPLGILLGFFGLLPHSPTTLAIGALFGFILLAGIRIVAFAIMQKEAVGEGDPELLAAIGAFVGPYGAWSSLVIGSLLGSVIGIALVIATRKRDTPLPFGPFLIAGAILYIFFPGALNYFLFFR